MVFPFDDDDDFSFELNDSKQNTGVEYSMGWVPGVAWAGGAVLVLALLVACCCRSKRKGRVLVPPPPLPPGTYPQQQYETPAVVPYPVVHVHNNSQSAPYPTVNAPYPAGHSPYPSGNAPYPTGQAPYPVGNAPYPGSSPYQSHAAPTAPDANALPPPYEVAVAHEKQPPYNPNH